MTTDWDQLLGANGMAIYDDSTGHERWAELLSSPSTNMAALEQIVLEVDVVGAAALVPFDPVDDDDVVWGSRIPTSSPRGEQPNEPPPDREVVDEAQSDRRFGSEWEVESPDPVHEVGAHRVEPPEFHDIAHIGGGYQSPTDPTPDEFEVSSDE